MSTPQLTGTVGVSSDTISLIAPNETPSTGSPLPPSGSLLSSGGSLLSSSGSLLSSGGSLLSSCGSAQLLVAPCYLHVIMLWLPATIWWLPAFIFQSGCRIQIHYPSWSFFCSTSCFYIYDLYEPCFWGLYHASSVFWASAVHQVIRRESEGYSYSDKYNNSIH